MRSGALVACAAGMARTAGRRFRHNICRSASARKQILHVLDDRAVVQSQVRTDVTLTLEDKRNIYADAINHRTHMSIKIGAFCIPGGCEGHKAVEVEKPFARNLLRRRLACVAQPIVCRSESNRSCLARDRQSERAVIQEIR